MNYDLLSMPSIHQDHSSEETIKALHERVKELSCLYFLSNLSMDHKLDLNQKMQAIVDYLPRAWQFPDLAVAELAIDNRSFSSNNLHGEMVTQQHPIHIYGLERGVLRMHYRIVADQIPTFLKEEFLLLKTLAQELSGIIERYEQSERERQYQDKIRHADRLSTLGEMTAGIAHELNTPLGNILGYSEIVKRHIDDSSMLEDIQKVIDSSIYAREVVKKLMFFSCAMPQRIQEKVDIKDLIEDVARLMKIKLREAQIELILEIKDAQRLKVEADPIQLTQLLFNLLLNGIHASKTGQKIKLSAWRESSEKVGLLVQDWGKGIQKEHLDRVFEPFFTTKKVGEGSGLGLSVVHGIIKSHNADIEVKSEPKQGTLFRIILPIKQPK
jgi:signal transduction histidine kinase